MKPWDSYGAPHREFAAVTPSDDPEDNFAKPTRALWVGTGGTIAVIPTGQTDPVTLTNVPNGTKLDIAIDRVNSTGTTDADDMVALF